MILNNDKFYVVVVVVVRKKERGGEKKVEYIFPSRERNRKSLTTVLNNKFNVIKEI